MQYAFGLEFWNSDLLVVKVVNLRNLISIMNLKIIYNLVFIYIYIYISIETKYLLSGKDSDSDKSVESDDDSSVIRYQKAIHVLKHDGKKDRRKEEDSS